MKEEEKINNRSWSSIKAAFMKFRFFLSQFIHRNGLKCKETFVFILKHSKIPKKATEFPWINLNLIFFIKISFYNSCDFLLSITTRQSIELITKNHRNTTQTHRIYFLEFILALERTHFLITMLKHVFFCRRNKAKTNLIHFLSIPKTFEV